MQPRDTFKLYRLAFQNSPLRARMDKPQSKGQIRIVVTLYCLCKEHLNRTTIDFFFPMLYFRHVNEEVREIPDSAAHINLCTTGHIELK